MGRTWCKFGTRPSCFPSVVPSFCRSTPTSALWMFLGHSILRTESPGAPPQTPTRQNDPKPDPVCPPARAFRFSLVETAGSGSAKRYPAVVLPNRDAAGHREKEREESVDWEPLYVRLLHQNGRRPAHIPTARTHDALGELPEPFPPIREPRPEEPPAREVAETTPVRTAAWFEPG